MDYAMRLITRTHPDLDEGLQAARVFEIRSKSKRCASLISGAKVRALMNGRYNVSFEDIEVLSYSVLRHRIALNFEAMTEGLTSDMVIERIISETGRGV